MFILTLLARHGASSAGILYYKINMGKFLYRYSYIYLLTSFSMIIKRLIFMLPEEFGGAYSRCFVRQSVLSELVCIITSKFMNQS